MIPTSQIKWFTMKSKVGEAPPSIRRYVAQELAVARKFPPRSENRSFFIGIARGAASMWPLCNGGNKK